MRPGGEREIVSRRYFLSCGEVAGRAHMEGTRNRRWVVLRRAALLRVRLGAGRCTAREQADAERAHGPAESGTIGGRHGVTRAVLVRARPPDFRVTLGGAVAAAISRSASSQSRRSSPCGHPRCCQTSCARLAITPVRLASPSSVIALFGCSSLTAELLLARLGSADPFSKRRARGSRRVGAGGRFAAGSARNGVRRREIARWRNRLYLCELQ